MPQHDSTYQQKMRYKSGTDKLTKFKLGENRPSVEHNMWHMFKVIRSNIPEIEIWHIFGLYSEKPESAVWLPN